MSKLQELKTTFLNTIKKDFPNTYRLHSKKNVIPLILLSSSTSFQEAKFITIDKNTYSYDKENIVLEDESFDEYFCTGFEDLDRELNELENLYNDNNNNNNNIKHKYKSE